MFSHVMVGVNDLEVSRKFYDAVRGTLGVGPSVANKHRYFYRSAGAKVRRASATWRTCVTRAATRFVRCIVRPSNKRSVFDSCLCTFHAGCSLI